MKKNKVIGLSLATILALQVGVFAQSEDIKNTSKLGDVEVIASDEDKESYTVKSMGTSTKLDLSIKDTPQSVSVFTRQKLEDQNINSLQDLLAKTPGITLNKWDERVSPTARGFKVDYYLFDGMPSYNMSANDIDLAMYERVEVVKGANGLTTGAGNPAMGMNFIRKHADSKEFTGNLNISAGSWNNYQATADVSMPLNEDGSVRGRFVVKKQDANSYMNRYEKSTDLFYGVVDMDLTDTTYLSIGAGYENLQRDGVRWGGLPAFYTDGTRTNYDRSKTVSGDWTYWDVKTKTYFTDLKQYIYDDISINLSLSQRDIETQTALAYFSGKVDKTTGLATGYPSRYSDVKHEKENNIDLYASIPFKVANLDQEIVVGTMFNKHKVTKYNWENANQSGVTIDPLNIADPGSNWTATGMNTLNNTTQKGIYLAGRFSLMEDLKLISGARVSSWEYEAEDGKGDRKFDNEVTPYLGLVYDINENHNIYTSYTSIFKPQNSRTESGNYLDPVEGASTEVGLKGSYFDDSLNASITLFKIEQDGVGEKIDGKFVLNTAEDAYRAVNGVESKGIELMVSGEVNDNLSLDVGLANFEAKDADGEKYDTSSSRTTANLFAKYIIDDYKFGVGINYKSKIYTGTGATKISQDAYFTSDVMAGYTINKDFDIQLNIKNLFDKKYYDRLGGNSMVYGDPRSFTATLKYSF